MNTKLLIFGLILMLSCKKAEPKPTEPEPITTQSTPIVEAKPKILTITGKWFYLLTKVNRVEQKQPFNVYVGDTLTISAESQPSFPYPSLDAYIYVYTDGKLIHEKYGFSKYETTLIIE